MLGAAEQHFRRTVWIGEHQLPPHEIDHLPLDTEHQKWVRILARGFRSAETDELVEPSFGQRSYRFKSFQRFDAYGAHRRSSFIRTRAVFLKTRKLDCFAACAAEIDPHRPRFPAS